MMKRAVILFGILASASLVPQLSSAAPTVQYFKGTVQRSSLDGKIPYGPAFDSMVRRTLDLKAGRIDECVSQEGKAFVTQLVATSAPLVYSATDAAGSFSGKITFEDATASAWSYDIQVVKPSAGRITGPLKGGQGARIDATTGKMTITKLWNDQVRIHEEYSPITKADYLAAALPSECR